MLKNRGRESEARVGGKKEGKKGRGKHLRAPAVLISRNGPRELCALCFRSTLQVLFQVGGKAARKPPRSATPMLLQTALFFFHREKNFPPVISSRSSINSVVPPLSICIAYLTLLNVTESQFQEYARHFFSFPFSDFTIGIFRGTRGNSEAKNIIINTRR